MQAGKLRHRVVIQQPAESQDAYGEPDFTWSTFATVWASIEPGRGQEYEQAQTVQQSITHRVMIRYCPGVTTQMRVKYTDRRGQTRYFDIEAVLDYQERGRTMELRCREQV